MIKDILKIAGGTAVGFLIGYFVKKKLDEKKTEEAVEKEIESYRQFLEMKYGIEFANSGGRIHPKEDNIPEAYKKEEKKDFSDYIEKTSIYRGPPEKPDLKELIRQAAERENPDDEEYDEEEELVSQEPDLRKEKPKREVKGDEPYIISLEEFTDEMPHYDKLCLNYYMEDSTLSDDQDQPIDDPVYLVGEEAFGLLGVEDGEQSTVYVRNPIISTDYEIAVVYGAFAPELGLDY